MDIEMIMVSSCLCGEKCKYNGGDNRNETVLRFCQAEEILQVCPEVLGGLPIPRMPAEIKGGTAQDVINGQARVVTCEGKDVTAAFLYGAKSIVALAKKYNIKKAILKANSPSCGCGHIYDGNFSGNKIKGNGVSTELLLQAGIEVLTEEQIVEK